MFDELAKSVKAQLYERASSPLFGSFVLSWCGWNYRFILVLISAGDPDKKFSYIDKNIYHEASDILGRGIIYPLASALLFIFLYLPISKYLYEYWQTQQKKLKEIQQKIEDETPLTQEEARQLRTDLREAHAKFDKELSEKDSQIESLKNQINDAPKNDEQIDALNAKLKLAEEEIEHLRLERIKKPYDSPAATTQSINTTQMKILKMVGEQSQNGIYLREVLNSFGSDKIMTEAQVDDLESLKYIQRINGGNGPVLFITKDGRSRYLKEVNHQNPSSP